jgi:hypothetical protein
MPRSIPKPVLAERYARALGDGDPIELQREAAARIGALVEGLSEGEMARKPAPDKWSIREVIAHLADGEVVLGARIRMVAAMDRPAIIGYDQDAFMARLRYERVRARDLLDAFAAVRALNVALLDRLPDEDFARVGIHSERGDESLATMVAMYAAHDRIHEAQIERTKAALGLGRA